MRFAIENQHIRVEVDSTGAELKSITGKREGTQFLYNGNGKHWEYSSPVLFPVVGRLKGGLYTLNGRRYEMPIHGFARFTEFEAERYSDTVLSFAMKSRGGTYMMYPFDFVLCIVYEIVENRIQITYEVKNTGTAAMFFGLGAHPGFLCPLEKNESFTDYYIEFNEKETADIMKVTEEGLFSHSRACFLDGENSIGLNYGLFENDALVFSNLKSDSVSLRSKNHKKHIRLDFGGFKYLGIWTVKGAPFVCIEPWHNHGDFEDFEGELSEKPDIIKIRPAEAFSSGLSISVFE